MQQLLQFLKSIPKLLNENFPNYRSFMLGLALAVCSAAYDLLRGDPIGFLMFIKALLIAALGYVVKDKLVTGGKIPQTPEAVNRAEPIEKVQIQPEVKNETKL